VIEVHGIPERVGGDAFLLFSDITDEARRMRIEREFVRNAAHELRTPLTAISTAIEVLQGGAKEDPADRDRFLEHIERQCVRLSRLTQSMLVLARAQSDQQAPRLEFVPLRPLLEDIATSLRPAERVTIEVDCADDLVIFVDRDLAEHAVLNLASNATRHTRDGTVRLAARALGERRVEIAVTDEGEGILPEHRDRLLEPFYRAGARDGNGFGLGLAISNQAIMALGGTLAIDSEPGVGTRAVITLPSARLVRTR
jgi:signal transduction histidine kinase